MKNIVIWVYKRYINKNIVIRVTQFIKNIVIQNTVIRVYV